MKDWAPSGAKNEKSKDQWEADEKVFCHNNITDVNLKMAGMATRKKQYTLFWAPSQ